MENKLLIREETASKLIALLQELPLKVSAECYNMLQSDINIHLQTKKQKES